MRDDCEMIVLDFSNAAKKKKKTSVLQTGEISVFFSVSFCLITKAGKKKKKLSESLFFLKRNALFHSSAIFLSLIYFIIIMLSIFSKHLVCAECLMPCFLFYVKILDLSCQ